MVGPSLTAHHGARRTTAQPPIEYPEIVQSLSSKCAVMRRVRRTRHLSGRAAGTGRADEAAALGVDFEQPVEGLCLEAGRLGQRQRHGATDIRAASEESRTLGSQPSLWRPKGLIGPVTGCFCYIHARAVCPAAPPTPHFGAPGTYRTSDRAFLRRPCSDALSGSSANPPLRRPKGVSGPVSRYSCWGAGEGKP